MNTKNIILASLISMSTFSTANVDVYEPMSYELPMLENVYVGAGYAYVTADADDKEEGNSLMLNVGYTINEYFSLEARYLQTFGDLDVSSKGNSKRKVINKALYLKSQYPLIGMFNIYGLVGYGETIARNTSGSGLQWGLGLTYLLENNMDLFLDYTNLYDGTLDDVKEIKNDNYDSSIDAVNVGFNYSF